MVIAGLTCFDLQDIEDPALDRHFEGSSGGISGIGGADSLDQKYVNFFHSDRAVFNSFRNDVEIPRTEMHIAISELNGQVSLDNEEEVVGVVVGVPDELTFEFGQHDVVAVELFDDLGGPML